MTAAPPQVGQDAAEPWPGQEPEDAGTGLAAGSGGPDAGGPDWRRWRVPLALIGFIVVGGIVIALIAGLTAPRNVNPYLDPANSSVAGAHALADILGERGSEVVRVYSPSTALDAVRRDRDQPASGGTASARAPATLVITSPSLLTGRQLRQLARTKADLFIVEPGRDALAVLAPGVGLAGLGTHFGKLLQPRCGLTAARLAGSANVGGFAYRAPTRAIGCYPAHGHPSVVRLTADGRTITILGGGAAMTNGQLAGNGNAALVLNLLGSPRHIVWLTPEPSGAVPVRHPGSPASATSSSPSLIPWPAWLVVIELGVAVVLAALWRARRLGPLITERLPVVVRASETVEGHARLYRSLRARDKAAAALREAMLSRVVPVLGLNRDAPDDAVADALAARSPLTRPEVAEIVYGPSPATDAALVSLARSLDELERQVRQQ
jgi:hypothetical protein